MKTYDVYELGQLDSHLDSEPVRIVAHWTDEPIVVAQEVIIKSLCIWIPSYRNEGQGQDDQSEGDPRC